MKRIKAIVRLTAALALLVGVGVAQAAGEHRKTPPLDPRQCLEQEEGPNGISVYRCGIGGYGPSRFGSMRRESLAF